METGLKCPRCGAAITRGEPRCPHCGTALVWKSPGAGVKFCTHCGGKLEAGQKFCPGCGASAAGGRATRFAAAGRESPRKPDHAEEERLRKQVKGYGLTGSGCFGGCLMAEVPIVVFLVGFAYHAAWVLPVVFVVAMAVATAKRGRAGSLLDAHDLAGAKAAAASARNWHLFAMAAETAMVGVHVWVLFNIVKVLSGISAALGNLGG